MINSKLNDTLSKLSEIYSFRDNLGISFGWLAGVVLVSCLTLFILVDFLKFFISFIELKKFAKSRKKTETKHHSRKFDLRKTIEHKKILDAKLQILFENS
jgi:hypothetical protein